MTRRGLGLRGRIGLLVIRRVGGIIGRLVNRLLEDSSGISSIGGKIGLLLILGRYKVYSVFW